MRSIRFEPCDALKPYIASLAIHESDSESEYKVLPDTGVVIGFQFKGKLSSVENGNKLSLSQSGVSGLMDRFRVFANSKNIGTVLVYFKESGAAHFFRQPIHELFRESISLDNFILRSELLTVEDKLNNAKTDIKRIAVVEDFLLSLLRPLVPDKLVATALAIIHQKKGNIRITELANHLNISQSPLEKRFRQVVGTSPKKFSSIVRMKHTVANFREHQSLTELGYEAGFYDQAHFIKEFKNFTGESPTSFLKPKT